MVELNFNPGDSVKIRLALDEVSGTVLESSEPGIVLLKLKSGYNVGFSKEKILGGKVLKRFNPEEKLEKLVFSEGKKNIGLVVTGGTIASKLDPKTGGVKHITEIGEFAKFYPGVFEIANISEVRMPFMVASESMGFEHWKEIAEAVKELLNDKSIEGVIVTHGTDFLGYTSAALSFFLKDLNKPVVLTYSQKSIDRASSDAKLNLESAARMALSDCAEVVVVGHGSINDDFCYAHLGTKVRKMHSSRRDAFKSVNAGPIARIFEDKVEFLESYRKKDSKKEVVLDGDFTDKVALVKFYPGQSPDILDFYALKYKGIVVEASGLGHLPVSESKESWLPKLKKHIREGFVVCVAPQTLYGRLDPRVYSNGRELLSSGVIFLEDMLPETGFVKLGWVLGHRGWKSKAGEKMLENFSGEISKKLGREFI